MGLAHMHYFQGHFAEVAACGAEMLSLGREYSDPWVVAVALFNQATAAFELGDYKQAAARAEEARQAAHACGEALDLGGPLVVLANLARSNGDYDRAQQLYDEAIKVLRHGGEVWALAILLTAAAGLSIVRDDLDQARAQASEAMSLSQDLEDPRGIACSLELFAGLIAAGGRAESAAQLWGASDALLERVSGSLAPNVSWIRDRYIEPMTASLGVPLFEAARAEGRAMPTVRAIELALQQAFLVH
jgi:tetratricopeptide (TPR) repeat protein